MGKPWVIEIVIDGFSSDINHPRQREREEDPARNEGRENDEGTFNEFLSPSRFAYRRPTVLNLKS
jgi:hypothetical protein